MQSGIYAGCYVTYQEFRCIKELLQGKTLDEVALALTLKESSVIAYLKNAKIRLNCATRRKMLIKILKSDLFRHVFYKNIITDEQVDVLNYNALMILEYLGNLNPTLEQISFMEELIKEILKL